jgi:hypothetical protein
MRHQGLGTQQKLTEDLVETLPVDGRDRITFDAGGFGVRVTRTGRKIFIAQARCAATCAELPSAGFRK